MKKNTAIKTITKPNEKPVVPTVLKVVGGASKGEPNKGRGNLHLVGGTDVKSRFEDIPLEKIQAGENWRKEFETPDFDAFVESVKTNGVLQSILVKVGEKKDTYIVVAGERRFRAAQKAELKTIPCRIMNLSAEMEMNAHIAENLQRKDLEPMEEAEGYLKLVTDAEKENKTLTITKIARRVGKPAEHVALRYSLNNLIDQAKKDLRDKLLEPKIAERIATLPIEQQKEAYGYCFDTKYVRNKPVADKTKPNSLRYINERIASKIMMDLSFAPFSTTSTELRADKLACTDCKERTGAEKLLFKEMHTGKKDFCLNKVCFAGKVQKKVELVQIETARETLLEKAPKQPKNAPALNFTQKEINSEIANIPRLSTDWYPNSSENVLGRNNYQEIKKAKDSCEFAVKGIFVKGERVGQMTLICLESKKCAKHYYISSASDKKTNSGDDYKKNRQQLYDLRADQKLRRKVFERAVEKFDENNTIWNDEYLRLLMLAGFIYSLGYNERSRRKMIVEILGIEDKNLESDSWNQTDVKISEIYGKLCALTPAVQSKLFLLLTLAPFGENEQESRTVNQNNLRGIAEHLKIDARLLEAEGMVDLCAEKYKKQLPLAKDYLEAVKSGDKEKQRPSFFYEAPATEAQKE